MTSCESNCKNMGTALEMYSTDHKGAYPGRMADLLPNYLKVIPTCAAAGADTYSATLQAQASPAAYTFYCSGSHHQSVGISANFPQYNSAQGLVSGH